MKSEKKCDTLSELIQNLKKQKSIDLRKKNDNIYIKSFQKIMENYHNEQIINKKFDLEDCYSGKEW